MFSCICPHAGEELWSILGHEDTIAYEAWPTYDEAKIVEDTIEVPIQINGKKRATIKIAKDAASEEVLAQAKEVVADKLVGTIRKEIYVPGKIINIVCK